MYYKKNLSQKKYSNSNSNNIGLRISSLSSILNLIRKYNFQFLLFYECLYNLFLDKHSLNLYLNENSSINFVILLKESLCTSELEKKLVASFIKKMLRFSLILTPSILIQILTIIRLILFKHSSCKEMIMDLKNNVLDPFDDNEPNPIKANGEKSKAWELGYLKSHYSLRVRKVVESFYNESEDVLNMNFGEITELTKESFFEIDRTITYTNYDPTLLDLVNKFGQ